VAHSTVVKNFRDGTIVLTDDTGAPITTTVIYEDGDFKLDGYAADLYEHANYEDRGVRSSSRKTKRAYPTFSFTAIMTDMADNTDKHLINAATKTGAYAAGVSTTAAKGDVWTLDMAITVEGTDFSDASDHVVDLDDCAFVVGLAEGDPNKLTISGTVYGTVTLT
jgi:hypothetical protein